MNSRAAIALVSVWVVWTALDFIIHAVVLSPVYAASAGPLQPMGDMPMGLMGLNTLIAAACLVALYLLLIRNQWRFSGTLYGLLFGLAVGLSLGFGIYASMPVSLTLALIWVLGFCFKSIVAGTVAALIVRPPYVEEDSDESE